VTFDVKCEIDGRFSTTILMTWSKGNFVKEIAA